MLFLICFVPVLQTVVLKDSVQAVVVDEADFMLSYGFEDDMKQIVQRLPPIFQGFLMSATLSTVPAALPFTSQVN
jgi:ATP-dependent RNA helicase DDX56/DBP9